MNRDIEIAKVSKWCRENGYTFHSRLDGSCYLRKKISKVTTAERLNGQGPEAPRTDYPPSTLTFGAN